MERMDADLHTPSPPLLEQPPQVLSRDGEERNTADDAESQRGDIAIRPDGIVARGGVGDLRA